MNRIGPGCAAQVCALGFGAVAALASPSAVRAECVFFDVSSGARLYQSNGAQVLLDIEQSDANFHGKARYFIPGASNGSDGVLVGAIDGPSIVFTVHWNDGTVGAYSGKIDGYSDSNDRLGIPRGIELKGSTVDQTNNASRATWRAHIPYRCLYDDGINPQTHLDFGIPPPPVVLGRTPAPAGTPPSPPMSICKRAADARARNSPVAADLEARCAVETPTIAASDAQRRGPITGVVAPSPRSGIKVGPRPGTPVAAADLAAAGAVIAARDPGLSQARALRPDPAYRRGFDIATGLFADPARGGEGLTAAGPQSSRVRDALDEAERRGFDAAVAFHLSHQHQH